MKETVIRSICCYSCQNGRYIVDKHDSMFNCETETAARRNDDLPSYEHTLLGTSCLASEPTQSTFLLLVLRIDEQGQGEKRGSRACMARYLDPRQLAPIIWETTERALPLIKECTAG